MALRNTLQYPITVEEITTCLDGLSKDFLKEERVGDMRPWLLSCASKIVAREDQLKKRLQALVDHMRRSSEDVPAHVITTLEQMIPFNDDHGNPRDLL